ncbi:hypothetical protein [Marivita geojedonensis]|uniref:hypothetical protein n=1 Tax=Marivita geojedonensis TaxID=1123756 RepID=UPI000A1F397E|nr:hypothetical protein [Marivita geojedonensis]PRY74725.1 hypothetical protein CLV76_11862 [Marivita geojedonensis]
MSDPVTNVEIEDVLSSIRKLVAEETRAPAPARKPTSVGRLVLTPAQRVHVDEPATEPVLLTQPIVEGTRPRPVEDTAFEDIPGDARLADFGDVEAAFPDIDSYEQGSAAEDEAAQETAWEPEQEPDAEDLALAEDEQEQDAWTPEPDDTSARSDLSRLIEEELAAALGVSDAADTTHDASSGSDDEDERAFDEEVGWDSVDPVEDGYEEDSAYQEVADTTEEAWAVEVPEPVEAREPDIPPQPAPPQTLEDKVAALSRLVSRDTEEFEEERDQPDADELTATAEPMEWPDPAPFVEVEEEPVEASSNVLHAPDVWPQATRSMPIPEPEPQPEPEVEAQSDLPVPAEHTPEHAAPALSIDEAELRDMVVEIVRQELQGALGERITRNVRKLVRREIHRMLISQDFE